MTPLLRKFWKTTGVFGRFSLTYFAGFHNGLPFQNSWETEVQLRFRQSDEHQNWRQIFFRNWHQKISIIFDSTTFYRYFQKLKIGTIDFLPLWYPIFTIAWKLALAGARSYILWKSLKNVIFTKKNLIDSFSPTMRFDFHDWMQTVARWRQVLYIVKIA